jgi:adenine-specific DNA glycosylase
MNKLFDLDVWYEKWRRNIFWNGRFEFIKPKKPYWNDELMDLGSVMRKAEYLLLV